MRLWHKHEWETGYVLRHREDDPHGEWYEEWSPPPLIQECVQCHRRRFIPTWPRRAVWRMVTAFVVFVVADVAFWVSWHPSSPIGWHVGVVAVLMGIMGGIGISWWAERGG